MENDYLNYDAIGLAELVRTGAASPIELVGAAISAAEALNSALNAIVLKDYDAARTRASARALREHDGARGTGDALAQGPLFGVPYLIKDLGAAVAGLPTSNGSRHYQHYVPGADDEIVARSRAAGLNIFGKTNTPELGQMPVTEPELFGPCRNPWSIDHTPGGSSGGAAAAVAAGIVPLAHASDGGGSIRIPASCCGLFGLKPSSAAQPTGFSTPGALGVDHAVSRTVRDSALLFDLTSRAVPLPSGAPGTCLAAMREPGPPLRVAFACEPMFATALSADVLAALNDAAHLVESLGHHIETVSLANLDFDALSHAFLVLWAEAAEQSVLGARAVTGRRPRRREFEVTTWAMAQAGRKISTKDLPAALACQQDAVAKMDEMMSYYDVLLTPTLAGPPVKIGQLRASAVEHFQLALLGTFPSEALARRLVERLPQKAFAWAGCTELFNLTGQPAMSVPLYWNDAGLPIGVQFVARAGREATLFRLAAQLEAARPWGHRRPPLGAWR
jgi:amidase